MALILAMMAICLIGPIFPMMNRQNDGMGGLVFAVLVVTITLTCILFT